MREHVAAAIPLGRLRGSTETADAALLLPSDKRSFVSGNEFFVDGGSAQI